MCGCGGVIEAAIVCYAAKKVYNMTKQNTSTSCKVCHSVAIPDKDICPECLVTQTPDPDTLDPFDDEDVETTDISPDYLRVLSAIHGL